MILCYNFGTCRERRPHCIKIHISDRNEKENQCNENNLNRGRSKDCVIFVILRYLHRVTKPNEKLSLVCRFHGGKDTRHYAVRKKYTAMIKKIANIYI